MLIFRESLSEKIMQNFHRDGICPIRDVLSRLGDKWSLLVLVSLQTNGVMRFGDLQRSIGDVSQRMLTVTLRTLEADGIVERKVYAEVPPRVEYSITPKGRSLEPLLDLMCEWGEKNMDERFELTNPQCTE